MATKPDPSNPSDPAQSRRPLFVVDEEEVAAILAMPLPPHDTVLDEDRLRDLVAGSFSITRAEKEELILSLPRMSQGQIDTLIQILTDGRERFRELNERHARRLAELDEESAAHDAEEEILALLGPR